MPTYWEISDKEVVSSFSLTILQHKNISHKNIYFIQFLGILYTLA
jgi:hypothetical protein